jgi:predicted N-acetyltransferase YhbS
MVLVRTLTHHDIDRAADLTVRAFGGDDSMRERVRLAYLHCPAMPLDLGYGVEVDGELVAKWQLLDLRVRLDDVVLPVVGSHALVVDPRFDGQGLVHAMLQAGHGHVTARGYLLMLGLAQRGGLYAAMGGAPVCAEYEWSFDPLTVAPEHTHAWRAATDADVPLLVELRNRAEEGRNLSLVRTEELWPWLDRRPKDLFVSDGGYVGVRFSEDAVEVRELGYRDPSFVHAALDLLTKIARERGAKRVFGHLPADHPLALASRTSGARVVTTYARRAGLMAGIVAVDPFVRTLVPILEKRLRRGPCAEVSVDLRLVVDGREHAVFLRGESARAARATISLSGGALVQLAFGYLGLRAFSLTEPEAFEGDADARAALETVFTEGHPFLAHTDRF